MKRAFTLIELLVVIAIIAILAAILFPVFAQAKQAAKKTADLSNLKQIGTASMLYVDSYDDTYYAHRLNCGADPATGAATQVCSEYLNGDGTLRADAPDQSSVGSAVNKRLYWVYMLQPYAKNYNMFSDPGSSSPFFPGGKTQVATLGGAGAQPGFNYGGQNSYGHNDVYLSPSNGTDGGSTVPTPPSTTSVPRPASTIMVVDAGYYGAAFDINNEAGFTDLTKLNGNEKTSNALWTVNSGYYQQYWKNLGSSDWSVTGGATSKADALAKIQKRYGGKLNVQWADGHAKSLDWHPIIGNICYWTTDADGAHPGCG